MALKINSASGSITLTAEDGSGNADVTIPRDGIVSDLSDLSITATATELNYVDGVTSNIQTQLDAKGTVSTLADLSVTASAAELNLLDGVTATTTELNYVDGVTSSIQTQIDGKLSTSLKGAASGLAELDSSGLVPTSQLPSYVDDVLEYTNASSFPGTGETGKIYVALDTNDIYRWSGSAYVKVSDAVSTSDQATALATARTIALTGDVTGSTSFDGSANVSITATIADDSHNHVISNVDGLQTALDGKLDLAGGTMTGNLDFGDNDRIRMGAGVHFEINHSTNTFLANQDGDLYINQLANDKDILIQNDNGSGGFTPYIKADGSHGTVNLFYYGSEKLKTQSGGVDVTGTLWSDDIHVSKASGNTQIGVQADSGIASIEVGGSTSAFIDIKVPYSDDFDTRYANNSLNCTGDYVLQRAGSTKLSINATGADVTGTLTTDGVTVDGTLDIEEVYEKVHTSTSTSGITNVSTDQYGIVYYTANQTGNRTINFTNVNANLGIGQSLTFTALMTQGSTAYYFNAYQVDGTAVTPKWSGGSAPTAGNASGIDVYTFTIIKTANATFTVLASVTQYA